MLKTFSVYRANYAALELVDALRNTAPEFPFETNLYKIVGNFHTEAPVRPITYSPIQQVTIPLPRVPIISPQ